MPTRHIRTRWCLTRSRSRRAAMPRSSGFPEARGHRPPPVTDATGSIRVAAADTLPPSFAVRHLGKRARREGRHPRRRTRHAPVGGDRLPAQAHGRDRRAADPVAHHEDLQPLRVQRLRRLPRLQGLRHQGVLLELLPAHVRRDLRHARQLDEGPPERRRAVARDARRHGRRDADRRPDQAGRRVHRRRDVHADLRRRRRRRRHREAARVPSGARQAGDDHGRPAAGALRRAARSTRTRSTGGSWRRACGPSRRSPSATAPG